MCKEELSFEHFGDCLVVCEFGTVITG